MGSSRAPRGRAHPRSIALRKNDGGAPRLTRTPSSPCPHEGGEGRGDGACQWQARERLTAQRCGSRLSLITARGLQSRRLKGTCRRHRQATRHRQLASPDSRLKSDTRPGCVSSAGTGLCLSPSQPRAICRRHTLRRGGGGERSHLSAKAMNTYPVYTRGP